MKIHSSLFACAVLAGAAAAQVPTLSHGAPKVGGPLTIELEGAPPAAWVRLYFSPEEASLGTPYGTLELQRSKLVLLASRAADAGGHFEHTQSLPLDSDLAETWGHYQALVQDASAPGGWVLSEAVHLRYLGTRLYETCVGEEWDSTVYPAELHVLSLVHERPVGVIPLAEGALPYTDVFDLHERGEPLFSADLSLGAVVPAPDRLVVFDNFQLRTTAVVALQGASLDLLPGLDGRSVVILEAGSGRILWVNLETAAVTDSLALPWPVSTLWTSPNGGREAWIGESAAGQPRPGLRRVDLEARAVLDTVLVGSPDGCQLRELRSTPDALFAVTRYWEGTYIDTSSLSFVDLSSPAPIVQVLEFGHDFVARMQPMNDLGMLAVALASTLGPSSHALNLSRISAPLELQAIPPPPSYYSGNDIEYQAFDSDGEVLWALHPCCDWDGGSGSLLRLSFHPLQWQEYGDYDDGGPSAMEFLHDGFVHVVGLALDGLPYAGNVEPGIDLFDVTTTNFHKLPGGWRPIALQEIQVP
jgi:hypothetical protein